ncbi:MAG TPA: 2-polyprenyl-3-methyl-6-methoxy-1,4-benzoquinone monooxygenase [Albitalea sp.]|uniref:2-polyprenyl-3-methyl-6-methoxy-1,4-benzoquinone monooxygenase n=1 Tax=Piscinibacter sp. TaxID=1903157 RepID=UPI002ED3DD03
MLDRLLVAADNALRTLAGANHASRPSPTQQLDVELTELDEHERRHAAGLMRVNHVGEVCAQALYHAQSLSTRDPQLRRHFEAAARDETDHLAWTRQRLDELGASTSLLNPLWYAGAFGIGLLAGRVSDAVSLGFVVETERQVERHLEGHLSALPSADARSQAIVRQMKDDEARHGASAQQAGAATLPAPVRWAMRAAAKVMTTTAYRL